MSTETIAAIASGVTGGGINIIRISGEKAITIIDRIFSPQKKGKKIEDEKTFTIHYGHIMDGEELIDEVIVLCMRAPKSYTKEDVIEINCHGGIIVTKRILEVVIKNGARTAEPGEFTKRAFLNGRIDLSQAEAVIDIINAKNKLALKNSVQQLRGQVLDRIKEIRKNILLDMAFIEAALDDPEHMSLDGYQPELAKKIEENIRQLVHLLNTSDNGRLIKEGIKTVILGKPNAGKSSLLNSIIGYERAIVTEIEGTTRDTLEEIIQLGNISLTLIDTAGIRETDDKVERMGVERTRKMAEEADLLIYVVDASKPLDKNDNDIIDVIKNKSVIVILNKTDLETVLSVEDVYLSTGLKALPFSAKERVGITELENMIESLFFHGKINFNDEIYITSLRQKEALKNAIESLKQVKNAIDQGLPEDFYSIDLMDSYEALGKMIGEVVDEDLVNTIFSEFCMGK